MLVGVPKETFPGERRVALIPAHVSQLAKSEIRVAVQAGAGQAAGYPDSEYRNKGAEVLDDRGEVFSRADVILQVRTLGANPEAGRDDLDRLREGQVVIGFGEPLSDPAPAREYAERRVSLLTVELMPRITRAQSMDALSSSASIAGYKCVLLAASELPKLFPMMMTAAGTITPAKVLVVGAGVAGLQAIATAKRLGAVVSAYDIRPVVKEQVESLGAKFVELPLETTEAEDTGGYAKAQSEEQVRKQRELMAKVVAESDVVITTAAVPGKKAPVLITESMVRGMHPGSVIVDAAAERGGNCELTKPGETVDVDGIRIAGPTNVPATVPFHASQTYSKNLVNYLRHLVKESNVVFDFEDEITHSTVVTHDGEVVHPTVRELAGLAPLDRGGSTAGEGEV